MQVFGKKYEKQQEEPAQIPAAAEQEPEQEALCGAVTKKRRLPGWMQAAGGIFRENRKHFAVAGSVLVIGFAVYLNWALYEEAGAEPLPSPPDTAEPSVSGAVLTEESGDDYFAVSMISRRRARDEAIEVLQNVVDGAENLSDVRGDALAEIAQIAEDIEHEAAIESLVKGKGFAACVAVISGENANVIVKSGALLPNEVTQIQEIVYETAGIAPANVKIIEK